MLYLNKLFKLILYRFSKFIYIEKLKLITNHNKNLTKTICKYLLKYNDFTYLLTGEI